MFKFLKGLHFLGLTLFFGSIAVYIVEGTPMSDPLLTQFVRNGIVQDIKILTLPGLIMMIITGLIMVFVRRELIKTTFFKVKLLLGLIILVNANYILAIAKQSALAAAKLPQSQVFLESLVLRESIAGALNVLLVLFLVFYSVSARKYSKS